MSPAVTTQTMVWTPPPRSRGQRAGSGAAAAETGDGVTVVLIVGPYAARAYPKTLCQCWVKAAWSDAMLLWNGTRTTFEAPTAC